MPQDAEARRRTLQACEIDILQRMARGEALPSLLERIALLIEQVIPGSMASILLIDEDGRYLRHGAAPNLPQAYVAAIDGGPIGPEEGSCGAAAALRQPVHVEDIATHPNWLKYRDAALAHGLRACWSTPIIGGQGELLGTFAVYYETARAAQPDELERISVATSLSALAIGRWRTDEALRASRKLYQEIVYSVREPVFRVEVTPDGRFWFTTVNPAFLRATGLSREQVVGQEVCTVVPAASYPMVERCYREAIQTGQPVRWEEVSVYPSGTRYGEVCVTPIFTDLGECTHLVGLIHDVTARAEAHQREAEQRRLQARLERAERLLAQGRLAAGMAHDFNNILVVIRLNTELIAANAQDPLTRQAAADVLEASGRAATLTRRALAFGADDREEPDPIDPLVPLREALRVLEAHRPPPVQLLVDLPARVSRITADHTDLYQILLNLGTNALQAVGGGGTVAIALEEQHLVAPALCTTGQRRPGRYLLLSVRDDGPGIPPAALDRIFEPYFTTRGESGTGLGLAIVYRCVLSMAGVIDVQTSPQGTWLGVWIPVQDAE